MYKVIIVLVNFNGWKDTIECLKSLMRLESKDFEIVLVDNKSTDNSIVFIKNWFKENNFNLQKISFNNLETTEIRLLKCGNNANAYLIENNKNEGFAGGNNIAVKFIHNYKKESHYIWFLNNDTIVECDALGSFINRFEAEKNGGNKVGILGGKLYYYNSDSVLQGIGGRYNKYFAAATPVGMNEKDYGQYDSKWPLFDYVIGASMFVSKEFIEDIGLMTEDYFLYFEELDWIERGKKKGWKIDFEPKVRVWHKEGASTEKKNKNVSVIADKCQVRNRLIFTKRFYPKYLIFVIPIVFISVINRIRRGQIKRALIIIVEIIKTLINIILRKI